MKLRRPSTLRLRPIAAGLLAVICLFLGGCVWLRLLTLKNQLAEFDRYFQVDEQGGLKLTCKEPVLLDDDMGFFKLVPEKREKIGTAERWYFRWIKAGAPTDERPEDFDVTADFLFSRHKLSKVTLPERLFAFFPKPLFVGMLRSVGQAKIDREKRTANTSYSTAPDAPAVVPMNKDQILAMLGAPMEKTESDEGSTWRYRYQKATPDQRAGNIDITILFNPTTHRIARMKGKIFEATINFAFDPPK